MSDLAKKLNRSLKASAKIQGKLNEAMARNSRDDLERRLQEHRTMLAEVASMLYGWARESQSGGWSTHHVEPQKQLAGRIHEFLAR